MRPVLAPRVSEEATQEATQGDLVAAWEALPVVEAVKENLEVAVARELTVAAKEDTVAAKEDPAVVREATEAEVAAKKELAEVADGEDRGEKIRISQINTESKGKK
jgi:hypothetical protein